MPISEKTFDVDSAGESEIVTLAQSVMIEETQDPASQTGDDSFLPPDENAVFLDTQGHIRSATASDEQDGGIEALAALDNSATGDLLDLCSGGFGTLPTTGNGGFDSLPKTGSLEFGSLPGSAGFGSLPKTGSAGLGSTSKSGSAGFGSTSKSGGISSEGVEPVSPVRVTVRDINFGAKDMTPTTVLPISLPTADLINMIFSDVMQSPITMTPIGNKAKLLSQTPLTRFKVRDPDNEDDDDDEVSRGEDSNMSRQRRSLFGAGMLDGEAEKSGDEHSDDEDEGSQSELVI
eukprot:sb/3467658/